MGHRVALTMIQPAEQGTLSAIFHLCRIWSWTILGLLALVLQGVLVFISLAVVAFITSAFATRRTANYIRALLLPWFLRSPL